MMNEWIGRLTTSALLFLIIRADPRQTGPEKRVGSQCFHVQGIPTLHLSCPHGSVIRIDQVFYGAPPTNDSCSYEAEEGHCIQLTDLNEHCNGRLICSIPVSNPFLMNCRQYANYMQINYTCVPTKSMQNICNGLVASRKLHQIRSPNYPYSPYPPNTHCACALKTEDAGIRIRILDFAVNSTEVRPAVCNSDYLRITDRAKMCGQVEAQKLPERFVISKNSATIEFWSNKEQTTRGFWVEVRGSKYGKIKMMCGTVKSKLTTPKQSATTSTSSAVTQPSIDVISSSMIDLIEIDKTEGFESFRNLITEIPFSDDLLSHMTYAIETRKLESNHFEAAEKRLDQETEERFDFEKHNNFGFDYNIGQAQIISGITVGILILIAIIIIIVLVFKR